MTNGQPPPPKVIDLQADTDAPLCPGETIKFEATTSPPSAIVTWKVAVNGGEPEVVEGDGNTLKVSAGGGQTTVVTASLANSLSKSATWKVADLKVTVPPGPHNGSYIITDEPRMPVITATAFFEGGSGTVSEWEGSVGFGADDCPPFGPDHLKTILRFSAMGGNQITADFGNVVRGGSIGFIAKGVVNDCTVSSNVAGAGLVGTNPQRTDIQAALPHHTLGRIACKESGQRQFNAPPNGGTGFCPLFGPGGKVGIMQIAKPTDDEVWNWRMNVAKGIEIFTERVNAARDYPNKVTNSDEFERLVSQFNQRRQQQGLDPIQIVLPPFAEGDFDENLQQLEMDAIRGYNGWNGADQFGLELHEFRVSVDPEEVLVVTNVNEETLQGEAVWERVPVADRPADIGSPNYVDEVLSFKFDCTPAVVPCILTGISPATLTRFRSQPATFTAEGTGLANVQWSAPGGTPATGTGATFTTKWLKTGEKTITATCGGTTKTATAIVLNLEIQINNTSSAKDDLVQVIGDHPRLVFIVPCQIRLRGPATAPVKIDLLDTNHRLQFAHPADPTFDTIITVELPFNGDWAPFVIAGVEASEKKGDAEIKAFHLADVVAVKKVTVFTFDLAKISLKRGGNYVLVGNDYRPDSGVAVSFSAKARLRPAGLDCAAPQIANLRVGIVQEIPNTIFRRTTTWDRPTVQWDPDPSVPPVPTDTKVTVKNRVLEEILFDSGPSEMSISKVVDAAPLWDNAADALKPPTGCTGAGAATSFAAPARPGLSPISEVLPSDDLHVTKAARVTWTRLVNTTLVATFRTYCVVFDTGTKKFCALRQAEWTLDVDSNGPRAKQHAIVHGDQAAVFDPAPPPQTDPKFVTLHTQVGAATTTFTK